jgi:prophage tail gpP-like protein
VLAPKHRLQDLDRSVNVDGKKVELKIFSQAVIVGYAQTLDQVVSSM